MQNLVRAVTLFELVLVCALFAIMAGLAAPSFSTMATRSHNYAVLQQVMHVLKFARLSAVKLGESVCLCASDDGQHCHGQFRDGYLVFIDATHQHKLFNQEDVLRQGHFGDKQDTIMYRGFPTSRYIQWQANGFTRGQNGSFYIAKHRLILSQTGRVRLE